MKQGRRQANVVTDGQALQLLSWFLGIWSKSVKCRGPTDLTQLAKKNGGIFPEQEVRDFIDGTKTAPSHGTREMPICGYQFSAPGRTGSGSSFSNVNVQQKIDLLVAYVKSIQQK